MSFSIVEVDMEEATFPQKFLRKVIYANGRFWVFYDDLDDLVYKTSLDGITWTSKTVLVPLAGIANFSIWFDGTYVHYARPKPGLGVSEVYYRRGTPQAGGTITWSAAEQTAVALGVDLEYYFPCVAVDTDGYPFIAYYYRWSGSSTYSPTVTKSSANDGTWTTDGGFPYELQGFHIGGDWAVIIVPLTNTRMYAFYNSNTTLFGRLWDGSAWGSEETIKVGLQGGAPFPTGYISAVNEGDDVHVVYLRSSSSDIDYQKRTYGSGWGGEVTVQAGTTTLTAPLLSIDTANSELYCFWLDKVNHIVNYKKRVGGAWDGAPTTWIEGQATQSLTTGNDLTEEIYGANWGSQSIISEKNDFIYQLNLYVGWKWTSGGIIDIDIYNADGTGRPTGAVLGSGTIIRDVDADTPCDWRHVTISPPAPTVAGQKYCIVVSSPGASSIDPARWCVDSSSPPYGDGNWAYSGNSGGSWTADNTKDALFRVIFASTGWRNDYISSFYQDYDSKIGVAFMGGAEYMIGLDNVVLNFDYLTPATPSPPTGLEDKSANMGARLIAAGVL